MSIYRTYQQPIGEEPELPISCEQKRSNFRSFPLNFQIPVNVHIKAKTHWKILKTLSSSSPNYFLSHHTTFSHNQTGATVHVRSHGFFRISPAILSRVRKPKCIAWICKSTNLTTSPHKLTESSYQKQRLTDTWVTQKKQSWIIHHWENEQT
jgi:hypothetical protein